MIEFIEEEHIYLIDGVIVPSVSEILHFIFPNKYKDVPEHILESKAEYGTKIHESIEMYEANLKTMSKEEAFDVTIQAKELNYIQIASLKQYLKLKEEYNIKVLDQEQMIHFEDKYAGRFDMIANINNIYSLCDIKTTAELDKEYLSWQLSLYAYAYEKLNSSNHFEKLYAIWLPKKGLGQIIEIERKSEKEILKVLEEYYEQSIFNRSSNQRTGIKIYTK